MNDVCSRACVGSTGVLLIHFPHKQSISKTKKITEFLHEVEAGAGIARNLENSGNLKNCQISEKTQGNLHFGNSRKMENM